MTSRKILVPIDLKNPYKNINDFLFPDIVDNKFVLIGIKSGKIWKNGIVSFLGGGINENDIFTKIVGNKPKIKSFGK